MVLRLPPYILLHFAEHALKAIQWCSLLLLFGYLEAVVAHGHKVVIVTCRLWVRFLLEEMKYLFKFILPFLRSGVEAERGVVFRHST